MDKPKKLSSGYKRWLRIKSDPVLYKEYKKRNLENARKRRRDNPKKYNTMAKEYRQSMRKKAVAFYSGGTNRCACCGENRFAFLAIDHINGGGNKIRKQMGISTAWEVTRAGFPPGYRIWCHNCNQARGTHGYCPHEVERGEVKIEE